MLSFKPLVDTTKKATTKFSLDWQLLKERKGDWTVCGEKKRRKLIPTDRDQDS